MTAHEHLTALIMGLSNRGEIDTLYDHEAELIARTILDANYRRIRKIDDLNGLLDLPRGTLVRAVERVLHGHEIARIYECVGTDNFLELDPSDRYDGENTAPAGLLLHMGKAGLYVIYEPNPGH